MGGRAALGLHTWTGCTQIRGNTAAQYSTKPREPRLGTIEPMRRYLVVPRPWGWGHGDGDGDGAMRCYLVVPRPLHATLAAIDRVLHEHIATHAGPAGIAMRVEEGPEIRVSTRSIQSTRSTRELSTWSTGSTAGGWPDSLHTAHPTVYGIVHEGVATGTVLLHHAAHGAHGYMGIIMATWAYGLVWPA